METVTLNFALPVDRLASTLLGQPWLKEADAASPGTIMKVRSHWENGVS